MAGRDLSDLMSRIGFLLLQWGLLEGDLQLAIRRLSPPRARGAPELHKWARLQARATPMLTERVEQIEAALDPVRDLRNLVAHGMRRAVTRAGGAGEAVLVCVDRDGARRHVTAAMIDEATATIEQWRRRIADFPR